MKTASIVAIVLGLTTNTAVAEPKEDLVPSEKKLDERCYQKPVCEAKDVFSHADPKFYFDGERCKAYAMRACYEKAPFTTQDECVITCYR
ncbi:MAG: hypothetical protein Q8Q01_04015 [archaeon]|nr:hypothetical protein [archaeon]